MSTTDRAVKIIVVAALASAAAYVGFRAYKKQYPFESRGRKSVAEEDVRNEDSAVESPAVQSVHGESESSKPGLELELESELELAAVARAQGNDCFKRGNYSQAVKHYDEAVSLYPVEHQDLALAYANRAACYLKLNRFDAVVSDCSNALSISPEFTKALDRRSRAYENMGRLADALVDVTAACIIDDFKTASLVERVETILRTLSTENAQRDFELKELRLPADSLIDEFFSTFPNEQLESLKGSDGALAEAVTALKNRNYALAMSLVENAVETAQGDSQAQAFNLRGTFEFLKGDMKAAEASFTKSIIINASDANVLVKMALVELEQNKFPQMTDYLERAFATDPKNPALYYHRGEILALSGSLDGAIRDFVTAIELCPTFALAYVHNARALLGLDRVSEAEEFLNKALERFSDNVEVQNSFGEALVLKRDFVGAASVFDKVLQSQPNSPQIYLNKALLAMNESNDIQTAEKNLRQAIEIEPSFEAAHLQLANLLLSNGKFEESMKHFDEAVKYARTLQELVSVHSLKCASVAQLKITESFPTLASKMKALTQSQV